MELLSGSVIFFFFSFFYCGGSLINDYIFRFGHLVGQRGLAGKMNRGKRLPPRDFRERWDHSRSILFYYLKIKQKLNK